MKLLVAGAARRHPEAAQFLGDFTSPVRRNTIGQTPVWAADNGCFGAFDRDGFLRMLDAIAAAPVRPKFVTVPDVVGSHERTLDRWHEWSREFQARGLPRALVLQNGIERMAPEHAVPWGIVDALFIGGDDAFKLGGWVHWCIQFARRSWSHGREGIWCHMGRVNSVKRLRHAIRIGCDSCDGSGMARFPRTLAIMVKALVHFQLSLL